jgi:DNA-binding IclR family transcriptional regulator
MRSKQIRQGDDRAMRLVAHPVTHGPQVSAGIGAVLDVLECLDRLGAASLSQLARETGIAKSTLHRVCGAMSERGWVAREPASGLIALGPRAALLARRAPTWSLLVSFERLAQELVARHNETTCLTVLDGRDSLFVAKRETTHPVRLVTPLGSRLPAFASASGRAMLAELPWEEVERLHAGAELITPTGRAVGGLAGLARLLATTRARGFAESVDETALGLHCVAVAVGTADATAITPAAITFCVPSGRMTTGRRAELVAELRRAAAELRAASDNPERAGLEPRRKATA